VAVVTKGAVRLEVETGSAWLEVGDMCVVPPVQHAWHTDERGGIFAFTAVPVA
jgi:quercetin dioxygenase-like cupin family protein